MTKYTVKFSQQIWKCYEMEIEAKSKKEAKKLFQKMIEEGEIDYEETFRNEVCDTGMELDDIFPCKISKSGLEEQIINRVYDEKH